MQTQACEVVRIADQLAECAHVAVTCTCRDERVRADALEEPGSECKLVLLPSTSGADTCRQLQLLDMQHNLSPSHQTRYIYNASLNRM